MKTTMNVKKEVEIKTLKVRAGVRYWEDSTVNGIEDENGDLIPCRNSENWCPIIDIDTGQIQNWEQGKTAEVHYKVCDQCSWDLEDEKGEVVLSQEDEYVPDTLSPKDSGYGDYIIMDIDENGFIKDWNFDIEDFLSDED